MLAWGAAAELPMLLLLTKADKLKRGAQQRQLAEVRRRLTAQRGDFSVEVFSAESGLGIECVQERLGGWLELPPRG